MTRPFLCFLLLSAAVGFGEAHAAAPLVRIETNMGGFTVQLDPDKAPLSVANFLQYVNEGFYANTLMHRSPANFVVQGGGYDKSVFPTPATHKSTHPPVKNESNNGLKNLRGTIAMARQGDPNYDSATSEFFVNVVKNDFLDYVSPTKPQYAVFGHVVDGMAVLDAINALPLKGGTDTDTFKEAPLKSPGNKPVVIISAAVSYAAAAGSSVNLEIAPYTPSTPDVSHQWEQVGGSGPTVVLADGGTSANLMFTAPTVNSHLLFKRTTTETASGKKTTALVDVAVQRDGNQRPVADAGVGGTVRAGAVLTLDGTGSVDPDSGDTIAAYLWKAPSGSVLSDPTSAKPATNIPLAALDKDLTFNLWANDGVSWNQDWNSSAAPPQWQPAPDLKSSVTFHVIDNQPPTVTVNSLTVREGAPFSLGATVTDPEGDGIAQYLWQKLVNGAWQSVSNQAKPSLTAPVVSADQTFTYRLQAADNLTGNPKTGVGQGTVKVLDNQPPTVTVTPPTLTVREGQSFTLGATVTDPEDDGIAKYDWQWLVNGGWKTISNQAKPSFTAPAVSGDQTLTFQLVAADNFTGAAKTGAGQASVRVLDNRPPVVKITAPAPVLEGKPLTLQGEVTDPDADAIAEYLWVQVINGKPQALPGGIAANGSSLNLMAPNVRKQETLSFRLYAVDGTTAVAKSAYADVQVNVDNDPTLLDCHAAFAYPVLKSQYQSYAYKSLIWPARGIVPVTVAGISAPKNQYKLKITGIMSDESVTSKAARDRTGPDATILHSRATPQQPKGFDYAAIRAERQTTGSAANGRVYGISFRASYKTQTCDGIVAVAVPVSADGKVVNDGLKYKATRRR